MISESLLRYYEDSIEEPLASVIQRAEEQAEWQWVAEHGPEDAPPRPPWPVGWCVRCMAWQPTSAAHGCPW